MANNTTPHHTLNIPADVQNVAELAACAAWKIAPMGRKGVDAAFAASSVIAKAMSLGLNDAVSVEGGRAAGYFAAEMARIERESAEFMAAL